MKEVFVLYKMIMCPLIMFPELALESLGSMLHWRKLLMYSLWAGGYALVVFYYGLAKSRWPYPFMTKLTIQGQ